MDIRARLTRAIRRGEGFKPVEIKPKRRVKYLHSSRRVDTSDIPEVDEKWFQKARLVKP